MIIVFHTLFILSISAYFGYSIYAKNKYDDVYWFNDLIFKSMTVMPQNPLAVAHAGDWVKFKCKINKKESINFNTTATINKIDRKTINAVLQSSVNGNSIPETEISHISHKNHQPLTIKDKGEELVTINEKCHACSWFEYEFCSTKEINNILRIKIWFTKDIPLAGIVKMKLYSAEGENEKTFAEIAGMEIISYDYGNNSNK